MGYGSHICSINYCGNPVAQGADGEYRLQRSHGHGEALKQTRLTVPILGAIGLKHFLHALKQ
jgi:hypothetical protein